jgi:hypothetical protein
MTEFDYVEARRETLLPIWLSVPKPLREWCRELVTREGLLNGGGLLSELTREQISGRSPDTSGRLLTMRNTTQQFPKEDIERLLTCLYGMGHYATASDVDSWVMLTGAYHRVEALFKGFGYAVKHADVSRHHKHKPGTSYDSDEIVAYLSGFIPRIGDKAAYRILRVVHGNYRVDPVRGKSPLRTEPHPFVVGPRTFRSLPEHVHVIGDDAICDYCGLPAYAHKSDVALLLSFDRDFGLSREQFSSLLVAIRNTISEHNASNPDDMIKIDGFAFTSESKPTLDRVQKEQEQIAT